MNIRRILAMVALIAGIALIGFGQYIKMKVAEGREEISDAQTKVDRSGALFSLSPYTKQAGEQLTDSAQKKIDEGKQEVGHYAALAYQLQLGGIVIGILGIIFLIIPRRSPRKH